ncbi:MULTISPECIES: CehA/McbA family metallohydrolase [unclassified Mesorhizobium]|uniref:CehA/McbA family metallohydrolase n=1 Tax=unclassified Mesorhizobium TaxID=325217 RepID=UPI001FD8B828|nr:MULTISPECIES: CehA/McbA family metallohydrolase [unclassified Mesorhizobium]WJI50383.1 CehA/McbA family metallohydrolase [Mesorhizobium sp. C089B]
MLELQPGDAATSIELVPTRATYLVFVQTAADLPAALPSGFGDNSPEDNPSAKFIESNELGSLVSTYAIRYADGSEIDVPIFRRFAIQQSHICWGASPFAATPALGPHVHATHSEDFALGRAPRADFGTAEFRTESGRAYSYGENLWLYALPNPSPDKQVIGVRLRAEKEASFIYAVSTTEVFEHPLRLQTRRKLRMRLPTGVNLNALGELDTDDRGRQIGIDLGTVISARSVLEYSNSDWLSDLPDVQPVKSNSEIIVEYSAHPDARIYLCSNDGSLFMRELRSLESPHNASNHPLEAIAIEPAAKPVKFSIIEAGTGRRVAARLHVHGPHGEYLAPRGHRRKVSVGLFEDLFAEFANNLNQYAYVDGACVIDLPLGSVFVEITRGVEVRPIRKLVEIDAGTESIIFELEKVLRWREQGWVSADTHVHFLSPQTALLEGRAEGVNVVNLLASQWGETFSNVGDFDGRTTVGAKNFGGDGEFLVRVGTENRMQVLGHISLLGYQGDIIDPLCTGGPEEAAIGDPLETTMAAWAERCRQQGGLVIMPHAPNPQAERAADIVLGLVDAIEAMSFNPRRWQIGAFALADWYRYLNVGYQLPLVAGSDKMDAASLLGGLRTYVHLGAREFTYENWMDAVRGGDTFITVGPLVKMAVEGRRPGDKIQLPPGGGRVTINWQIESVSVPTKRLEVIRNGMVIDEFRYNSLSCEGQTSVQVSESCWVAIRLRGSVAGRDADISAHTSSIFVEIGGKPIFATADAVAILAQIEGSIAYIDTLAPKADETRHARLRATLELAHHRLHHKIHHLGVRHEHTPIHSLHKKREH